MVIMGIKKIMLITFQVLRICHDIKEHSYFNSPVCKQFVFKQLLSKHSTMTRQLHANYLVKQTIDDL